ncbi:QueT transporter family protein [Periweissella cryptocerci]|uniref:QueT transporter family protein n=1 Tax=Periweissella cryptocerci TaxID=2506420 RepID=A0A4P6YUT4_9LACO|nr:QueT transporter family protein [Periweissella cryptocerci]QBO36559.1 QueT transporter family protein [Periweissella cryptocerci]
MDNVQTKTAVKVKIKPAAQIALIGVVAAMYVVITAFIAPFSFGPVQLRLSEMLNHLAAFNKRYIVAVTLGVVIANMFFGLGIIDVIAGSLQTLIMTSLAYLLTRKVKSTIVKLSITTVITTLMMWVIALELPVVLHQKMLFWPTYISLMIGELGSMVIGGVIVYALSKRVDLTE